MVGRHTATWQLQLQFQLNLTQLSSAPGGCSGGCCHPPDDLEAVLAEVASVKLGHHNSQLLHTQAARELQVRQASSQREIGGWWKLGLSCCGTDGKRCRRGAWWVQQAAPRLNTPLGAGRTWACSRVWPPPDTLPGSGGSKPASKPPGEPSTISNAASACTPSEIMQRCG